MNNLRHTHLLALLVVTLITLFASEAALSLDPLGLYYYDDMERAAELLMPSDSGGYTFAPGDHPLTHSHFTMREDGTRLVPATDDGAARTLILLGDSVTFGWGVNDNETWANIIAAQFPDWRVINTAIPSFNSENVRQTMVYYTDADAFIYLIIDNDAEPTRHPISDEPIHASHQSWSARYLGYFTQPQTGNSTSELARFRDDLRSIDANPRVLMVAFQTPLTDVAATVAPDLHIIPDYAGHNSYADAHANAAGNQEIAGSLYPLLVDFLAG